MKKAAVEPVVTGTSRTNGKTVWSGTLSFGLVTIPVRLYVCARARDSSLHLFCSAHASRVMRPTYCIIGGEAFPTFEALDRCFEYATEEGIKNIQISNSELESIQPDSSKVLEVAGFVPLASVDPLWFESSWYMLADYGWEQKLAVLRHCMAATKRGAIARYCSHNRENVVIVRPIPGGLIMHSLYYQDEVRAMPGAPYLGVLPTEEVRMGKQLIRALSGTFDPSVFKDNYNEALQELIAYKIVEAEPPKRAKKPVRQPSTDLMSAIKDSLKEIKKKRKKNA